MIGSNIYITNKYYLKNYISSLIKSMQTRVLADGGTFEAQSCLKTTLESLNLTYTVTFISSPVISGSTSIGSTMTTTNGVVNGITPINYTYQWYLDGNPISGATNSTYTITNTGTLTCIVTGTNIYGAVSQVSNSLEVTLLLDTYGSAAAAYSLRQLSSATTNVIRVRRSSDNAEQNFTASQITDGTLTTFCGVGNGFVTTWYDQSGLNRNAIQTTLLNQPQIVNSGSLILENGNPTLKFDGANDNLQYAGEILNQGSFVGFCVLKNNRTSGIGRIFDQSNINGGAILTNNLTNSFIETFGITSIGNIILTDTQYYLNQILQVGQILSGNSKSRINGIDKVTDSSVFTMSGNTGINFVIGDNSPPSSNQLNANLQEIVIYTTNNNSNIIGIEAEINNHYNIY